MPYHVNNLYAERFPGPCDSAALGFGQDCLPRRMSTALKGQEELMHAQLTPVPAFKPLITVPMNTSLIRLRSMSGMSRP